MPGSNFFSPLTSTVDIALVDGTTSSTVRDGLAYYARCTGVPPTTANVYAHGCLMVRTDSGTGNPAVYQNEGSSAVPSWSLLSTGGGVSYPSVLATVNDVDIVPAAATLIYTVPVGSTLIVTSVVMNSTAYAGAANPTLGMGITPAFNEVFTGKATVFSDVGQAQMIFVPADNVVFPVFAAGAEINLNVEVGGAGTLTADVHLIGILI